MVPNLYICGYDICVLYTTVVTECMSAVVESEGDEGCWVAAKIVVRVAGPLAL